MTNEPCPGASHAAGLLAADRWPRRRVADLAQHSLGKMLDKAKNRGEPRPYLRNLNVRWFDFDLSDVLEMRFLPSEVERYTVRKGDVVVCEGGYPGRAAIWEDDEPIYFQKALHRVRFREPEHARWFLYYLHARDLDGTLREHFNGAGIQHFTGEALARFELPVPPLDEQRRIVAVLDEAFAGIAAARANAERNLRNARALFEGRLQRVYFDHRGDWDEHPVGAIARHSLGKMLDKAKNKGEPRRYLRNVNVRWFGFDLSDMLEMRFMPEEDARYTAVKGDLLICEGGEPGRAAIWNEDEPVHFQKALHRVRCHEPAHNAWLLYYLSALQSSGRLLPHLTGTGIQHLTGEALGRLLVPLPLPAEVRRLVTEFTALRNECLLLESVCQRKLAALDELKQSLLHHAFTGQLTARVTATHDA